MSFKGSRLALVVLLSSAFVLMGNGYRTENAAIETAGNTYNGKNRNNKGTDKEAYKAGDGEAVKKLKEGSLDDARKSGKPICVYLFDPSNKRNARAKLMEGANGLDSAAVKDKLKEFYFIKISVGDKDLKGWPADWTAKAKDNAAVMFLSADLTQVIGLDKDTPKDSITSDTFLADIETILKYDELKNAQQSKAPKPVAEKAPEAKK